MTLYPFFLSLSIPKNRNSVFHQLQVTGCDLLRLCLHILTNPPFHRIREAACQIILQEAGRESILSFEHTDSLPFSCPASWLCRLWSQYPLLHLCPARAWRGKNQHILCRFPFHRCPPLPAAVPWDPLLFLFHCPAFYAGRHLAGKFWICSGIRITFL